MLTSQKNYFAFNYDGCPVNYSPGFTLLKMAMLLLSL
jgi:hypothetical protein